MEQISRAIESINEAGGQSVSGTRQFEQEVKQLQDLARQLNRLIDVKATTQARPTMIDDDEEFLRDLMKVFREDAEEHIKLLSQAVVELEATGEGDATHAPIETLFRETHSLKGASGAVEHAQMESICQSTESVLAALKRGELALSPAAIDALSDSVDCLHACLVAEPRADHRAAEVVSRLLALVDPARQKTDGEQTKTTKESPSRAGKETKTEPAPRKVSSPEPKAKAVPAVEEPNQPEPNQSATRAAGVAPVTDTVRVSTNKLESLMLQAEEFISVKLAAGQRSAALRDVSSRMETWKREWYQARLGGDQHKMEEFLEWNSSFIEGLVADIRLLAKSADDERRSLAPLVDDLLDGMKRVLMLPVSSLLSSFPKMVRDLARDREKLVELSIKGADIEVDKRIIENLKDPLIHILRNSVDHGIETPEIRQNVGKPPRGLILIAVSQLENNKIQICVSDDGAGVNVQQLRDVALREGLRTQKQLDTIDDAEVLRLAFDSGISTSAEVSKVSGRGLGLAIVEQKVKLLGGSVTLATHVGMGTEFRIEVPATLATARGILAQVSDWSFVMPLVGVDRVVRVHKEDVHMVENRETIQVEGHTLPLVYMHEVLDLPLKPQRNVSEHIQAVVAGSGESRVAFAVDHIVDEQEVLVKTLGPQLVRVRNIAGVTIIGSGQVVPIINIVDLLQSSVSRSARGRRLQADSEDDGARKAVLVAEDSITSRMLLKNVLEAAGYYVKPTVDGVDALKALRDEDFDLVVSDIEMPRMDGFELTKKIRNDPRLARVPVILVTAMESQEHTEQGLEAGANAYLTKSSFTQGTLLKTARSLL